MASSLSTSSDREALLKHRHPTGAGNDERVVAGGQKSGWHMEVDRIARLLGGDRDSDADLALRVDDLAGVRRRIDVGRNDEFEDEGRTAVDVDDLFRRA